MGKLEWGFSSCDVWQKKMAVNFLVVAYRGFGTNKGYPDYKGVQADSQVSLRC